MLGGVLGSVLGGVVACVIMEGITRVIKCVMHISFLCLAAVLVSFYLICPGAHRLGFRLG